MDRNSIDPIPSHALLPIKKMPRQSDGARWEEALWEARSARSVPLSEMFMQKVSTSQ
jgi:hypothetical protein